MNISKIKNKVLIGLAAGIAAVGLAASPALAAAPTQDIEQLNSPGGYGFLSAQVTWDSVSGFSINGASTLRDTASDGHGPYLHIYGSTTNNRGEYVSQGKFGACDIHNTSGAGTGISVSNCAGIAPNLKAISVWVCNGGNAAGYAPDQCYGRVYFNKNSSSLGSRSLGNVTQTFGYNTIIV